MLNYNDALFVRAMGDVYFDMKERDTEYNLKQGERIGVKKVNPLTIVKLYRTGLEEAFYSKSGILLYPLPKNWEKDESYKKVMVKIEKDFGLCLGEESLDRRLVKIKRG